MLQRDFMNLGFCQDIADRPPAFDGYIAEVLFKHQQLLAGFRFQDDLDGLRLPVCVGAKIQNARIRSAFGQCIFPVTADGCDGETFDVIRPEFAVPVNHVINGSAVVPFKHIQVKDVFPDKHLIGYLHNLIDS